MTIQVACDCGFRKEVPDHWKGMRVTCKCGRSFVICEEGGVVEPPVAAPPVGHAETPQPPGQQKPVEASQPPEGIGISSQRKTGSVAAQYRARHNPADSRKKLILYGGAGIAMICLCALVFLLKDGFLAGSAGTANDKQAATKKTQPKKTPPTKTEPSKIQEQPTRSPENQGDGGLATTLPGSGLSGETGGLTPRIAETIELTAEDGILLTGLFGDEYKQLEISTEQATSIEELASQVKEKEDGLVSGEIDLVQWYVDGEKLGSDLLALLTDDQRANMLTLIESKKITRMPFEDYAARLRPELRLPTVSWKIQPDAISAPEIKKCELGSSIVGAHLLAQSACGTLAIANAGSDSSNYDVWNLLTDTRIGTCNVPAPGPEDTTIVAQGGQAIVRGGPTQDGNYRVRVWAVGSDAAPKSTVLPAQRRSAVTPYRLVDCVANRVLCVAGSGFWVWDLESGETRQASFSKWVADELPVCAVSAGGQYVAATHRHHQTVEAKDHHFLEVAIYDMGSGDLLGNQAFATDYQPMRVGALAFSYNGRGLALLWDTEAPEPKRLLMSLSAVDGMLKHTVEDFPIPSMGYARQHDLPQRELMWLPNNSGWVVNLQSLADTESESAITFELPPALRSENADRRPLLDAVPAGNLHLLFITTDPSTGHVQGQMFELPELSPFM